MPLYAVAITQKQANGFVASRHRHHPPVRGDKFRCGAADENGLLRGIVQVGRPVSRMLDDGQTCEVVRLCTDGCKNACSFLYARAARAARELGYARIVTYILDGESGASLKAAGWTKEGCTQGGSWDRPSRRRDGSSPTDKKQRWAKKLTDCHMELTSNRVEADAEF